MIISREKQIVGALFLIVFFLALIWVALMPGKIEIKKIIKENVIATSTIKINNSSYTKEVYLLSNEIIKDLPDCALVETGTTGYCKESNWRTDNDGFDFDGVCINKIK